MLDPLTCTPGDVATAVHHLPRRRPVTARSQALASQAAKLPTTAEATDLLEGSGAMRCAALGHSNVGNRCAESKPPDGRAGSPRHALRNETVASHAFGP